MTEIVNNNKACCTVPPVEAEYTPKGTYETIEGLKTYVTGPADATKVVIHVYDIFGVTPQALQGADLIAAGSNVKVWLPDFFNNTHVDHDLFAPPQTAEKGEKIQKLFSGVANPATNLVTFEKVIAAAKSKGFTKVGAVGFCWGAKITFQSPNLDAKAVAHPSLLTAEDANDITVPVALFPSQNEDMEIMAALHSTLSEKPFASKNAYHVYEDDVHGFAGARANLKDERENKVFHDAYTRITKFFNGAL